MTDTTDSRLPDRKALRSFVLRYVQAFTQRETITVKAVHQDDFLVLFGLLQRVRRLAQAHLRLSKDGFGTESQILVRAALEHAVTAQWAYLTVGGVDRLRVEATRDRLSFVEVVGAGFDDPEFLVELDRLRDGVIPGVGMPRWSAVMREMDDETGFVSRSYKVLSQVTHVTHQANLDAIIVENDEIALRIEPENRFDHQVLYALTSCCMLSAWLLAHMAGDDAEQAKLRGLSVDLALPWRLDSRLPVARRRFSVEGDDTTAQG